MSKSKSLLLLVLFGIMSLGVTAQSSTAIGTVRQFYSFDGAHSQVFNERSVRERKRWFSSELASLFENELKRQDEYLKSNPTDKPYFGDGFPFQPIQEVCDAGRLHLSRRTTYKRDFEQGARAAVTVTFAYPKPCKDPDAITYTVGLVKARGVWLIDDLNTGEDHSLKEVLKRRDY